MVFNPFDSSECPLSNGQNTMSNRALEIGVRTIFGDVFSSISLTFRNFVEPSAVRAPPHTQKKKSEFEFMFHSALLVLTVHFQAFHVFVSGFVRPQALGVLRPGASLSPVGGMGGKGFTTLQPNKENKTHRAATVTAPTDLKFGPLPNPIGRTRCRTFVATHSRHGPLRH